MTPLEWAAAACVPIQDGYGTIGMFAINFVCSNAAYAETSPFGLTDLTVLIGLI